MNSTDMRSYCDKTFFERRDVDVAKSDILL